MKQLTKKQKEIELIRALKNFLSNDLQDRLINALKEALNTENLPPEVFQQGNKLLLRIVIEDYLKNEFKNFFKQ